MLMPTELQSSNEVSYITWLGKKRRVEMNKCRLAENCWEFSEGLANLLRLYPQIQRSEWSWSTKRSWPVCWARSSGELRVLLASSLPILEKTPVLADSGLKIPENFTSDTTNVTARTSKFKYDQGMQSFRNPLLVAAGATYISLRAKYYSNFSHWSIICRLTANILRPPLISTGVPAKN